MTILSEGGNFLKADDVKDGDLITFKAEGKWVESQWKYADGNAKKQYIMPIDYKGAEYNISIGSYSKEELIPAYGNDTAKWVGKNAKIKIEYYRSLKKSGIILQPTEKQSQATAEEKEVWEEEK